MNYEEEAKRAAENYRDAFPDPSFLLCSHYAQQVKPQGIDHRNWFYLLSDTLHKEDAKYANTVIQISIAAEKEIDEEKPPSSNDFVFPASFKPETKETPSFYFPTNQGAKA
ncbi:MAG: hypothetical protein R8M45_05930 [Ghiorsea sp.]